MQYDQKKQFNLKERRPQVLFLGNGLFYQDCNWDEFIDICCKENLDKTEWDTVKNGIPYSIRANIACDLEDSKRRAKYIEQLKCFHTDGRIYEKENIHLSKLLAIPFDAIVTTNYTYQIENCLDSRFVTLSDEVIQKKYSCTSLPKSAKSDSTFLLHTFNRVNGVDVWHAHGEARRKSSIVLTHDEYGRLTGEIRDYFRINANRYELFGEEFNCRTWMDYLIMGDVYVLGYGADFAEFDFWWLLSRRKREKSPVGSLTFYEPYREKDRPKHFALSHSGLEVKNRGFDFSKKPEQYAEFYASAIEDIKKNVSE